MMILLTQRGFGEALFAELRKLLPGQADLSADILHAIDLSPRFYLHLGPWQIPISDAVIGMWIALPLIALLGWWLGRRTEPRPGMRQTLTEVLIGLLFNICRDAGLHDDESERVIPFVGSLALFIVVNNLVSLFGIKPPAQNIGFPAALAILSIIVVIATGIRLVGLRGFWQSLSHPVGALLPFKILDYFIKPLSLAFRLFGNVFGAFILMEFVSLVIPLILPGLVGLWFDLGDGIIQGVIFAYLNIVYIGEIVEAAREPAHA